jgi:hypothetical protein
VLRRLRGGNIQKFGGGLSSGHRSETPSRGDVLTY